MKKSTIASLITLAFTSTSYAAESVDLNAVVVTANRFENKETETTYASEIHTSKQIEASGAATLYDYLSQQTSLNVLSNFGNKATPSINLRGYGSASGAQNVVITIDGQRLNNIDGQPQLLGAIPLSNIERIEISKGSGSVVYGDGATAGAIQIYTKNKTGITVGTSFGNYGQQNHYLNAGISEKYFDISASLAHDSYNGFSEPDKTGNKDKFNSNTQNVKLKIKPTDDLRFIAQGTSSRNDLRYPNYLTQAQFNADPSQNGKPANSYTHQGLDSDQWRIGAEYDITKEFKLSATHYQEDKTSEYPFYVANYDYASNDIALSFNNETLSTMIGYQDFNGDRNTSTDVTTKDNKAVFMQAEYRLAAPLTLSAGYRNEKVKYRYKPAGSSSISASENLIAWDIGTNYRFNEALSVFANYNQAFQAPDIDRFFVSDYSAYPVVTTSFNGFIQPEKSKTINLGLNYVTERNRLKTTLFYARLTNEIYYFKDNINFIERNTNIDKSHKYGLEIQDSFNINDQLGTSLIYNYTRAIIDKENEALGAYNGKNLPGVPQHTVVANLNYRFLNHASLNLSHTWRSKAYAADDFQNNFSQRQESYQSTDIALSYQYKNLHFFTSVNNLFEHENAIQIKDDVLYPVDFARTIRVGVKADF
ncbi:MAG: TonB-dependent receptor [Methylophilaceae bacterium]